MVQFWSPAVLRRAFWITLLVGACVVINAPYSDGVNVAWMAVAKFTFFFNASTSLGALAYSKNEIESDPTRLPGETFNIRWKDSGCNSKAAVGAIFEYVEDPTFVPDLVLGPICSGAMAPVAQLSSYLNLPVFGWISSDPPLADKQLYSTLVRFLWSINNIGEGISILCEKAGWKRASIISTEGGDQGVLAGAVKSVLEKDSSFLVQRWVSGLQVKPTQAVIKDALGKVKDEARIIILVVPDDEIRNWTIGAFDSGMSKGDYVIIYTNQQTPEESQFNFFTSREFWEKGDSRDPDVLKMMESLIMVYAKTLPFETSNRYLTDFESAAKDLPIVYPVKPDFYSLFLYDALKVYTRYATSTGSINDGRLLFDEARSSLTTGGATGDIILSDECDRIPDYWFFDLGPDEKFIVAAETKTTLDGTVINRAMNILDDFRWSDGTKGLDSAPEDTPKCGFYGEKCENITIYWAVPLVIVLLIVIIGLIVFFYRKRKYEQDLNSLVWKLNYDEMQLYMGNRLPGSQMNLRAQSQNLRKSKASVGDSLVGEQLFITVANYKGTMVAIRKVEKPQGIKLDRPLLQEMKRMIEVKHNNLNTFIGACTDPSKTVCCCWEYCTKGSLQDVIFNDSIKLDDMFKFSITVDLLKGVGYLHETNLKVHGRLKSSNVVIDGRWACKLTDFGMDEFTKDEEQDPEQSDHNKYSKLYWTPPEELRNSTEGDDVDTVSDSCRCHTSAGDIYAAGIILKETFCRNSPYHDQEDLLEPKEIIQKVLVLEKQPFRPSLSDVPSSIESNKEVAEKLQKFIAQMWSEEPGERPTAAQAGKTLAKISPFKKTNVVDNMVSMMEKYSSQLEEIVSERTLELVEEQKKTEDLLFKMLPKSVAQDLKQGKSVPAEAFESVTIYFSDIPGFADLVATCSPLQIVDILNGVYSLMDDTINNHDVYKVETVGDVYVLASGLPVRNGAHHVVEVVNCSLDLISRITTFTVPHRPKHKLAIRIGINTGPIVTGVVGLTNPRYCLFGDTMNTASRMESNGKPLRIHISPSCYEALSKFSGYQVASRGEIPVKGKGMMKTYWIIGRDGYSNKLPDYRSDLKKDQPVPVFLPTTVGKTTNPKVLRPSAESGFVDMAGDSRKSSSISAVNASSNGIITPSNIGVVSSEGGNPGSDPNATNGGLTVVDVTSSTV